MSSLTMIPMKHTETLDMSVKHIELNQQGEAVKRFFKSLQVSGEGSVVELNGHALARVVPVAPNKQEAGGKWTDILNARRCDLIDKKYSESLSVEEEAELASLQERMLRYRRQVAPWPIEDARRLHQELLTKALQAKKHA